MERLQYLVDELQETLSLKTFAKFETPSDLHYLAEKWPWETKEEVEIIHLICESDLCSQATALMLFWLAQPKDYTAYKFGSKAPYANDIFEIIQLILKRFEAGEYKHYDIHYDPRGDMPSDDIKIDERMKIAVSGEETWYDEEYISKTSVYVPSELESEIRCCTDKDYLNMFANGLSHFRVRDIQNVGALIVQNPICDRGTALLLYWRLLGFYFKHGLSPGETEAQIPLVKQIHENFLAGVYGEGLAYDPLTDKENAKLLGKQKTEWEIPEYMKQTV